jgi:sulfane dehydrogenase subunit SoxC
MRKGENMDIVKRKFSRRELLIGGGAAVASLAVARFALAQNAIGVPESNTTPGAPASELGMRSPFEKPRRNPTSPYAGILQNSQTDLSYQMGVITPSDLHYQRNHNGVPTIDPATYQLFIHGMVDHPKVFTLQDLKRFPQKSVQHFMECSGDSSGHYSGYPPTATIVQTHGIYSNSEWIGVPLSILFREVGVQAGTKWFLSESYDAAAMTRSIPIEKGWDDAMIAYGQNGEPIRPDQGYPARLLLPGYEGNMNMKWIRRIKVSDKPFYTREETSKYTDPLPAEGKSRIFTFEWDAKSVITSPSGGMTMPGTGFTEISGLAWSGRGKISKVEVSTDGGKTWGDAVLQLPIYTKAGTRFRYPWYWDGNEAVILSRCTDEIGYIQPTRNQILQARGVSIYHFNGIQAWRIGTDGKVTNTYHEASLPGFPAVPTALNGNWQMQDDCGRLFI